MTEKRTRSSNGPFLMRRLPDESNSFATDASSPRSRRSRCSGRIREHLKRK